MSKALENNARRADSYATDSFVNVRLLELFERNISAIHNTSLPSDLVDCDGSLGACAKGSAYRSRPRAPRHRILLRVSARR
jgi:hypothetical protein